MKIKMDYIITKLYLISDSYFMTLIIGNLHYKLTKLNYRKQWNILKEVRDDKKQLVSKRTKWNLYLN